MWPSRAAATPLVPLQPLVEEVERQLSCATSSGAVARAANDWSDAADAHGLPASAVEAQLDRWAAACRTRAGLVRVGHRLHLAALLRAH